MKKIFTTKVLVIFIILLSLFVSELIFDYVEILLGAFVELTNPVRPQSGAIWKMNSNDQLAAQQLSDISENLPITEGSEKIDNLVQLKALLNDQETIVISAADFLRLYTLFPPKLAQAVLAPFALLRLLNSAQWVSTKIIKGERNLSIFFLDADSQLLMDSYPDISVIDDVASSTQFQSNVLNSMPPFAGRTFAADQFFNALLKLPDYLKLQLSNPFQLIQWYGKIKSVAISRYMKNHTVVIGFEVVDGMDNQIQTFEASEIAIDYLISQLNSLYPDLNLDKPEP